MGAAVVGRQPPHDNNHDDKHNHDNHHNDDNHHIRTWARWPWHSQRRRGDGAALCDAMRMCARIAECAQLHTAVWGGAGEVCTEHHALLRDIFAEDSHGAQSAGRTR